MKTLVLSLCLCLISTLACAQWKWAYMYRTHDDYLKGAACDSLDMDYINNKSVIYHDTVNGKYKPVWRKLSSFKQDYWGCRWGGTTWVFQTSHNKVLKLYIDGDIQMYGSLFTEFYYHPEWESNQVMTSQMSLTELGVLYFKKGSGDLHPQTVAGTNLNFFNEMVKIDEEATAELYKNTDAEPIFRAIRAIMVYNANSSEHKFE